MPISVHPYASSTGRRIARRVAVPAASVVALAMTLASVAGAAPTGAWTNIASIPVGSSPNQFAFSPDGSRLYVSVNDGVDVIDTATNTVTTSVGVPDGNTGIAVTPTGSVYVVSTDGTVSVIDPANTTVTTTVGVDASALGMAAAGTAVYVTQPSSGSVAVIDTATNTVRTSIPVGAFPILAAALDDTVYVSNAGSGTVSAIDSATDTVTATIAVGGAPAGIAAAVGRVYVVEGRSQAVTVIDAASNTVVDTITVGGGILTGVAVTDDGSTLFVNQSDTDTTAVISTADQASRQSVAVGARPGGAIAGSTAAYIGNGEAASVSVLTTEQSPCAPACVPGTPFGS